mgnify:CR=1 FL=1
MENEKKHKNGKKMQRKSEPGHQTENKIEDAVN